MKTLIKMILTVISTPIAILFGMAVWVGLLGMGPMSLIETLWLQFYRWVKNQEFDNDKDGMGYTMLIACFWFIPTQPYRYFFK